MKRIIQALSLVSVLLSLALGAVAANESDLLTGSFGVSSQEPMTGGEYSMTGGFQAEVTGVWSMPAPETPETPAAPSFSIYLPFVTR